MGTKQMTPFFPSSHSLFLIFISEFENAQNSFSCSPPFGPFWSVKYLNFWPKVHPFRQLITLLQKADILRLLKIYIMFCLHAGAKYPFFQAPAHGLRSVQVGFEDGRQVGSFIKHSRSNVLMKFSRRLLSIAKLNLQVTQFCHTDKSTNLMIFINGQ